MPSDLDPTASSWGTKDMLPATDEIGEAVDFAQGVANNTGYLIYRPVNLVNNIDVTSTTNHTRYWAWAGTYVAEASGTYDADAGWADADGTISINGTTIWEITGHDGGDPAVTGEESVSGVILKDGTVDVQVYAEDQGASYDSYWTNVYVRIRQTSD